MKKTYILMVAFVLVLAMNGIPYAYAYPPGGFDVIDCTAILRLEMIALNGETLTVTGSMRIQRGDPYNPHDDHMTIDTEIVEMSLTGTSSLLGPITVVQSPTKPSNGSIRQKIISNDFPADSFFDVFLEIQTDGPASTYHNDDPVRVSTTIDFIPPLGAYTSEAPVLLKDEGDNIVGSIEYLSFGMGTEPTPPPPPVGGFRILTLLDTVKDLTPWIGVALIAAALIVVSVKARRQGQ